MDKPRASKWYSRLLYSRVPLRDEEGEQADGKDEERDVDITIPRRRANHAVALRAAALLIIGMLCALSIVYVLGPSNADRHPHAKMTHAGVHKHPRPHGDEAHNRPHQPPHKAQCGSSPTEARQLNCIFEQQLGAWVPSACAWPEVRDEFLDVVGDMHAEWQWFWDKELTREVAVDEVPRLQSGNFSIIYTTYPQAHALHCLYCWRKVEYAIEHGIGLVDSRCHQFWHTKHCVTLLAETLTDQDEKHRGLTYPLLYHDCVGLTSIKES
ncbi:hypothetical protein LZ32DRAFT_684397 [Colletotrichum eremochloae]|nr:hypothetical protein LZ32DRAFT_684397 [Colletotrichum eremochloae]